MSDYQEIANTVARFMAAIDGCDWDTAEALMTSPFHLDYSSFGAGDPADLEPRDVLGPWAALLPGFDHTHHQLGNLDVEVNGDSAAVACHVTAHHVIDEQIWTVVGTYDQMLVREAGGWKLSGLRLNYKYQAGALELPALAAERAAP